MANVRAAKSGLSKETQNKLNSKYDDEFAVQCLEWVREVVNSSLDSGDEQPLSFEVDGSQQNLYDILHTGVVLARLVNALIPKAIPANKYLRPPKLPFKQMELIELFIRHVRDFGVPDYERFQTVDLYERQNLHQVLICLHSLGRKAKSKGLKGFGPKEAEMNKRQFTDEQLRAGRNIIGLQMGTNKGASQAGMTFGKQRMIID